MEVICYACGKGEFPENTLEAIAHCQSISSSWRIEMDVQLTKDGEVVLFHDANTKRTTNLDKSVAETNYSELKTMNAGYNFQQKEVFPYRKNPVTIPLLKDVFWHFPKAKFLLDIHTKDVQIVDKTIALIEKAYCDKQVVIVSKYHYILKAFRQKRPFWEYGASSKEVKQYLVAHYLGFGKFVRPRASIMMMPLSYNGKKILATSLVKSINNKEKKLWLWLHEGKEVITVDSKNQFDSIKNYNANAFFTSNPRKLYNEVFNA
ncbi:glycerophosphodiester phosphodiesterase family protein [Flagellimonas pacifica]|uniref:Glycerophosphoryl diester phosphodiesterase n=1 Tax=Flagellimonas pacifica TaxID=1247520 RepID=A0A285MX84_9FLAO|nr:glycerophosphodiester phosphodiesterase family protein [Allomuricauda parva]SNZ01784.1 glycerophosphoryl diester phosphodiesterase [Allomuricauda parva]